MSQILKIAYTKIDKCNIADVLLNTHDHCTGHVYLIDSSKNILLGHNEKHDNVCSFGGFSNPGETLMETIIREFSEETLDCVLTSDSLKSYILSSSVVITRRSIKGQHYTVFCEVENRNFDLLKINNELKKARTNPSLTPDQLENDRIVMVNLSTIANAINFEDNKLKNITIFDSTNEKVNIRDINIPAYKWFIQSLNDNNLDGIF